MIYLEVGDFFSMSNMISIEKMSENILFLLYLKLFLEQVTS